VTLTYEHEKSSKAPARKDGTPTLTEHPISNRRPPTNTLNNEEKTLERIKSKKYERQHQRRVKIEWKSVSNKFNEVPTRPIVGKKYDLKNDCIRSEDHQMQTRYRYKGGKQHLGMLRFGHSLLESSVRLKQLNREKISCKT
jgi:hypothetical protein